MSPSTLGLIIFSVTLSAFAQICLKIGMSAHGVQKAISSSNVSGMAYAVLSNPAVVGGLALYGFGAIVWLSVLARIDVSIAYPFVGISFLITAALAVLILGEPISTPMIIGTSLVILGIVILARG